MARFSILKDLARKELTEHLDQYAGSKALVWDETLTGPLDLIANYQFLREREVIKMFPLKPGRLPTSGAKNIIFVTKPTIGLMDRIATNVLGEEQSRSGNERPDFHILFVPSRSILCERRLKDKGVYGSFTFIDELSIFWYPLDSDIISMEDNSVFRNFHLDKDPTVLHTVAKGVMALQALYGVIPHVYGKGKGARQVYEYMTKMRKEMIADEPQISPKIDKLIILDRQIDLVSPLATQLTYEGLIDEFFGIRQNSVRLPAEKFMSIEASSESPSTSYNEIKQITLNSTEELYSELRDKNFSAVGPVLSKKAKSIATEYEGRHGAKTVRELKEFVDRIPQMQVAKQSLSVHTAIAEMLKERVDDRRFFEGLQVEQELLNFQNVDRALDYVEDAASQEEDIMKILRIICLQSVVNTGLKPKVLEAYRRLLLQSYGFRHALSLINLEKLGLLHPQQSTRNYAVLRKRLNLTRDDINEQNPNDIGYVHSIYAPITIRLVQQLISPGWRSIRDLLDLLPGPTVDETQTISANLRKSKKFSDSPRTTLVLFIGGCTFAEISALRFLSQQEESNEDFLIATTNVINGNSFLKSVMENVSDAMFDF